MRRRSPVRSVLAERKMFAGGGMLPISTPMKKEPSGILASSEPLIDAVSQEILAPMTGGAMPMAQGGIARFQRGGGAISLGQAPDMDMSFLPDFKSSVERFNEMIDSGAFRTQPTVAEAVIEAAPPPTDMSFLPNFKSSVERFNKMIDSGAFRTQPQEREESGAQPPSTEQPLSTDLTGTPSFRSRRDIDADLSVPSTDLTETPLVGMNIDDELVKQENVDLGGDVTKKKPFSDEVSKNLNKYTQNLGGLNAYLGQDPKNIPASALSDSIDGIIGSAIKAASGAKFDKEAFKNEIESLLPAVEDDPETEGLLIAMLGASIMAGKDPNALVNIGKGVEEGLPALIKFKNNKKEAERNRQMTAAKLTIQEGLSRDKEVRKAVSGLKNLQTTSQIKEATRMLTPKDWWVSESTTIDPELIGGKKGDPAVFIPKGTTLNLNETAFKKLSALGVKAMPLDRGSWKPSDFLDNQDTVANAKHVKAMNEYGTPKQVEVFKRFVKEGGLKINYYIPSYGATLAGAKSENMINTSELDAFMGAYRNVQQPALNLRNDVREILDLVISDPRKFSGPGQLLDQATDIIRSIPGAEGVVDYLESVGATETLGLRDQAQTKSLIVLAKIAPILLDESGKTISDADRRMIAQTLGLKAIPNDPDDASKGFRIELNAGIFRNPKQIELAISQTEQALNDRLTAIRAEAKTHLSQFGIPSSAKQMMALEREQELFEKGPKFKKFGKGEDQVGPLSDDFNFVIGS